MGNFCFTRDEVDILLLMPFCITLTWHIVFLIKKKQLQNHCQCQWRGQCDFTYKGQRSAESDAVSTPFLSCLSMARHDLPQHGEAGEIGPQNPGIQPGPCTHYTHVAPASGSPPGQPQTAYDCLLQFFVLGFFFFTLQNTLFKNMVSWKKINCNHFQLHEN